MARREPGEFWSLKISSFAVVRHDDLKALHANSARLRSLEGYVERHLINWEVSLEHELAAKEVWCLSPNLQWARAHWPEIFDSLRSDDERTFRYIIFDNKVRENSELALKNAEYIINEASKDPQIANRDRIQFLFLNRDGSPCFWKPSYGPVRPTAVSSEWAYLPIPTDIAVFKDTPANPKDQHSDKATFAVMSLLPIDDTLPAFVKEGIFSEDDREEFRARSEKYREAARRLWDVKLPESDHYDPIKWWFISEWRTRELREQNRG